MCFEIIGGFFVRLFICAKYLLSIFYVFGVVLGVRRIVVNKIDKNFCFVGLTF